MKLLYCPNCGDIFNLTFALKACSCGQVVGKYENEVTAVVNGEGYSLAFGNGSFHNAVFHQQPTFYYKRKHEDEPIATFLAWARPHNGPMNGHTRIDPKLRKQK